jgi:DNA polymerase III subunit delta'
VRLASIVGHRRLTVLLSQALRRGTLPPTLLFAGPAGVGKFAVARAVAATLNCLSPITNDSGLAVDACGACRACDRIARGMHVDVLTLEPDEKTSIKVDVVREMLSKTGYRPFEGRRRAVLIRDAETLEEGAQNALLKALEEPPPGTVFILTTAVPGVLLPTVRSRCMRLRFARLAEAEIETVLTRHGFDAEKARLAAALGDGSAGDILALDSTADIAGLRQVAISLLRQAAATASVPSRLQSAGMLTMSGKKERTRDEVTIVLRFARSILRDIERLNAGAGEHGLANAGSANDIRSLQPAYGGSRAREAFNTVTRAITALGRPQYAGPKVVSDWVAVRI